MVSIPKNVDNGNFMRVAGKGDYNPGVRLRGDLILKVEVNKVDDFEKIGMDLIYYKKITAIDVLTKKQILVPHPDGEISLKLPKNIDTSKPLIVKTKWFRLDTNGDLIVNQFLKFEKF